MQIGSSLLNILASSTGLKTVILISRDNSKVVLKGKSRVFFKYLLNVNALGLPKMTFYVGMRSLRGKSAWVTGYIKGRVQWMELLQAVWTRQVPAFICPLLGFSPPFNYIKAAGTTGYWSLRITLIARSLSLISCCFSSSNFCMASWSRRSAASCCRLFSSFREEMVVWSSAMI